MRANDGLAMLLSTAYLDASLSTRVFAKHAEVQEMEHSHQWMPGRASQASGDVQPERVAHAYRGRACDVAERCRAVDAVTTGALRRVCPCGLLRSLYSDLDLIISCMAGRSPHYQRETVTVATHLLAEIQGADALHVYNHWDTKLHAAYRRVVK